MLLQDLRKAIKPGMWIIAIAFVASLFFMYGRSEKKQKPLVEVNGVAISYQKFAQNYQIAYENYRQMLKEEPSPETETYLKSYVLNLVRNALIEDELLWQEAKKAKIKVSEEELTEAIKKIMESLGSKETFMSFLDYWHISYSDFKEDKMKEMAINELTQRIKESAEVSDEEAKDYWIMENEKIGVCYLFLEPDKYKKEVKTTLEEIEKYYQEHLTYFQVPEKRKASHILIKLASASKEDEKKAREKIEKIEKELKEEADFAALAKKYSEDSFSAEKGGDLEEFLIYSEMSQVVPSFAEALFSLKKEGEISQIVKTSFGYHLIKLTGIEKAHIKPFQEVTEETKEKLIEEKAIKIAETKANQIEEKVKESQNLSLLAKELNLEYKNIESFTRTGGMEDIINSPDKEKFVQTAFSLKKDEISKPLKLSTGYYIIKLTQRELLLEDFFKEKEKFKENLLSQKREKTFTLWRQKLIEKAKIVDNSSLYIP